MVSALAPSAPPVIRRRFMASEYYTMLNAGVFHEDDRLELVEGEISEVSDSSVDYNRNVKAPLYARSGVAELWLVNLPDHQLEIYRNPTPGGYGEHHGIKPGATVTPVAFVDVTLAVEDILG